MGPYLVDSNFFIQAHRTVYPLDVVPSFWDKINQLATDGKIICIDKVKNELYKNEDDLKTWCVANLPDNFFRDTATSVPAYARLTAWAMSMSTQYVPKAIEEFLDVDEADAWLVAYALTNNIPIVTHEVSAPLGKNKIKIPDVCIQFRVNYVNTIEMFRQLGERF